jgi:rubrerythrin
MVKFGILKTKIETLLLESYSNNTFKNEIKTFNKLVLGNKNISKLFYLYDELNSNKGLSESIAKEFVFESITLYENLINKVQNKDIKLIMDWVSKTKVDNQYEHIDNLLGRSDDVLNLENKIKNKKIIVENLQKEPYRNNNTNINIPINSMLNIANKTYSEYISNLTESEQKEVIGLLKMDESTLERTFNELRDDAIVKLTLLTVNEGDESVRNTINETIDNIKIKTPDRLELFKLQSLIDKL